MNRTLHRCLPGLGSLALGSVIMGLAVLSGDRPTRPWRAPAPASIAVPVRPVAYHTRPATIQPEEFLALSGRSAPRPSVRVQLSDVLREGRLEVRSDSGLLVLDPDRHTLIAQAPGNTTYTVSMTDDGRGLSGPTGKDLPAARIRLQPISPDTPLETGDRAFYGALEVSLGANGLDVLNEVAQEDYIAGVVAGESARSFPLEALKAQAVAARTYALSQRGNRGPNVDVVDTVADQVYTGANVAWPEVREAATATAGEVLTYGGKPIIAYYSADCGGWTRTNAAAGLGKGALPYLKPVRDQEPNGQDYCATSPGHTWTRRLTDEEIVPGLNESLDLGIEGLEDIRFSRVYSDGRVGEVTVLGFGAPETTAAREPAPAARTLVASGPIEEEPAAPAGEAAGPDGTEQPDPAPTTEPTKEEAPTETPAADTPETEADQTPEPNAPDQTPVRPEIRRFLRAYDFRKAVGTDILRSQIMSVEPDGDGAWLFRGRGYGHGVGMCQWGACGLAKNGVTYDRILKRYYAGVTLERHAPETGALEGIAKEADGTPFANATVALAGTDRVARTDASGRFRFEALPGATYDIVVTPADAPAIASYAWTVRPNETTNAVVRTG